MATVAGYAVMPVIPSFDNISREIDKQISGPLSKASKQAGDALEKGVGAGIEQAGDRAEKAQYRVKKATQELEQAQSKVAAATNAQAAAQAKVEAAAIKVSEAQRKHETAVNSALDAYEKMRKSGTASADELAAAERKITDVRSKGQADIVSKEGALESARGRLVTATQRVSDAQSKLNDAELEHLTASSKAEQAADELAKAQADAGRATEETSGIFDKFRSQVRDMGSEMEETARKSGGFGSMLADGFKTMGKGALMGVGAKAGTMLMDGVHTAVSKGMDRLGAIEQAQTMLKGLGHDAESVQSIMDSASKSVDGTAFGLGEAAGLAATFSAAGVKEGDDLTRVLKLVADTAAITGKELGDIGPIFAKVAARGKLGTEEMNQLLERQLGIMPALQEKYGKTAEEVQKMVTEGKVSFEDFADVMEGMVGGSAETMGNTFSASLKNMQAALGRVGATLLKPVFQNAPILFNAVKDALKAVQKQLEPIMEEVSARLTPVVEKFAQSLGPALVGVINGIGDAFAWITQKTGPVVDQMKLIGEAVQVAFGEISHAFQGDDWGFGQLAEWFGGDTAQTIVNAAAMIGDAFRGAKDAVSEFAGALMGTAGDALRTVRDTLQTLWDIVGPLLVPAFEALAAVAGGVLVGSLKLALDAVKALADVATWLIDHVVRPALNLIDEVAKKTRDSQLAMDLLRGALVSVGGAFATAKLPAMAGQLAKIGVEAGKAAVNIARMAAANVVKAIKALGDGFKSAHNAVKLFNSALVANPLGAALVAITALTAGLVYFFTKTETGKKLWADFTAFVGEKWAALTDGVKLAWESTTSALAGAWDSVKSVFASAYENYIKPTFDAMVEAGKWLFQVLGTALLTPLVLAWEAMSWAVQAAWTNIIKPTWDALAAGAQWLCNNALMPVFNFIQAGWQALGDGVQWVWANVIKPAWDAVAAGANWLWQNALKPAFDGIVAAWNALGTAIQWTYTNVIQPAWDLLVAGLQTMWDGVQVIFGWVQSSWQALGDGLRWVYDNTIQPVWDAFGAGLTWLHDNVVAPVTGWIADKWRQMGDALGSVKDWVVDKVFGGMKAGLDKLQDWFRSAVDGIRSIWDGVKAATAKPVRFVVDAVYNNGIRKAWNLVAKFTGLHELEQADLGSLGAYARGGVLPGYTPGRDVYQMVDPRTGTRVDLSGGEGIMRPEWVRAVGGPSAVEAMNKAAISGGIAGVRRMLGGDPSGFVSRFAKGGVFHPNGDTKRKEEVSGRVVAAQDFVRSQHGKPYQWGGAGDPSWDCSGLWSGIVRVINGQTGFEGRLFNTTSLMANPGAFGFSPGLHGPVTVGVSDDHMAGTLGGINAESAGGGKGVQLGGSAWGSDNGYFPHQYTMDAILGEFISGGVGGSGGGFNLAQHVKALWDSVVSHLPKWTGPGMIGQLPGAMATKLAESAWEFIKSKIGSAFGRSSGTAGNAESWRDMAMWAMRREGFNADDPAQVNAMLAQIMSESGGIPDRNQEIVDVNGTGASAGQGLLQIIPGTFAAYRDPSLPDDRTNPEANMVAALRYYRARYGTDLTTMWGQGHGYATGGVLPGYTPGRDVHQFFSPTAGWLGLSGGEAIMVPEWTRAVGGPSAVEAMNKAARGGRVSATTGFANGGVYGSAGAQFDSAVASLQDAADEIRVAFQGGDFGYGALAATLRNEEWAKSIVNGAAMLGKIADYNSLEGVAARSFATEMAGIVGMLGGTTISGITTSLVDAERDIWDAREASADRLEGIAEKEKALEEARANAAKLRSDAPELSVKDQRKLADAEEALAKARKEADESANSNAKSEEARAKSKEKSDQKVADAEKKLARVREDLGIKEGESAEKRSEDIQKADEQVVKAEKELAAARKASARALDIRIYDVAPQINGMLSQAAEATVQVPAVSQALAGLAAAAGPAGMTVGVALQYVKSTIQVVQKVGAAIGDFVARIFDARAKTYANMVTVLNLQHEWAKMVDEQAAKVVELRVAWVEAQVALRDATWKTRLAQADVVRAQLQGVKSVAEAEAKLEAERKRVAQAALFDFDDLSLAYDRYRWAEYQGMKDRLDLYAQVTPEILALEAEVNVAKLNALAAQKEASLSALQASWEQQKAALALMQTQQNLALQTQQLAVMQREFFGMSQADSLQAMNTMKLRQELAEVQAQQGKNFWRLSYWLTGAHRADNQRERELKAQIAQREGSGAGVNVGGTGGLMSFFGYGDSALNAAKNAGYGKAERAMFEAQEQQALLQIEQQKQQLQQQIEQSKLFEEYQKQIGALTAEIESLKTGASAAQYTADYYREENPAVKAANLALARFEAERSSQYAAVGRGEKQVVEITIPEQDVYTREQMELVLRSVQEIPELEARIRKVESPATPGANVAMRSMIGG